MEVNSDSVEVGGRDTARTKSSAIRAHTGSPKDAGRDSAGCWFDQSLIVSLVDRDGDFHRFELIGRIKRGHLTAVQIDDGPVIQAETQLRIRARSGSTGARKVIRAGRFTPS